MMMLYVDDMRNEKEMDDGDGERNEKQNETKQDEMRDDDDDALRVPFRQWEWHEVSAVFYI